MFEVWKKKTNLIPFQIWFFFITINFFSLSFALCFVSYLLSSSSFFPFFFLKYVNVSPFFVSCFNLF